MFPRSNIYQLLSNDSNTTTTTTTNDDNNTTIDEENNNQQSDIEIIDLCHSSPSIVSLTTTNNTMDISTASNELPFLVPPSSTMDIKQNEPTTLLILSPSPYTPHTLQQENNPRYSILPAFPTSIYNNQAAYLLLANVPKNKLNDEQLARRHKGVYPITYTIRKEYFDIPSYFRDSYQTFMSSLIYQFNIDESILDYNLQRFSKCFQIFASNYIQRHRYFAEEFELNDKQKKYAFEFYLQIDVDLFFLKTCSFRNTQPRSTDEGLFCIDEPTAEYHLIPCNNCPLCVPPYNPIRRQSQQHAFIQFGHNQQFQFLNGYKTILNCHTYCHTKNIIYVMTCPCGQYEYIGETSLQLIDRLWYHRQHFNRIIHEFLIGERNVQLTRSQHKDSETLTKDRMLLYRHACRCPNAMQIFLNFNPIYHCFIPITMQKSIEQSRNYSLPSSLILHDSIIPTSIGSRDRRFASGTAGTRSDESVRTCMRQIPLVPPDYTFSIRQRVEQFQYFKNNLDIITKQDETIDLFNVAIIAVLPHDASHTARRFVESLFITHTEAKLNTSGHLLQQQDENNTSDCVHPMSYEAKIIDRGNWCQNLVLRHF